MRLKPLYFDILLTFQMGSATRVRKIGYFKPVRFLKLGLNL